MTSFKSELKVFPIDYDTAMNVVMNKHYLKRKCCCTQAFGLFKDGMGDDLFNGTLMGVIVFGKPSSYTLCDGICGPEESKNVVEFNRLWVDDCMPRNTESFFVGKAISMCDYEIIVSFADSEQGHVGYIYQATNWIYTGESPRQKYYRPMLQSDNEGGVDYRRRERMSKQDIVEKYGEEMVDEYYSSMKHRYIYFNASKKRKKELLSKLKYEIKPYPKKL